jgi:hypothetical protein
VCRMSSGISIRSFSINYRSARTRRARIVPLDSRNPFTSTRRPLVSALQRTSSNSVALVVKMDPPGRLKVIDGQPLNADNAAIAPLTSTSLPSSPSSSSVIFRARNTPSDRTPPSTSTSPPTRSVGGEDAAGERTLRLDRPTILQ